MELKELSALVGQWYYTGRISAEDKVRLQTEFIRVTGDPGERCTSCNNWWSDVQMGLINYLREQNFPLMKRTGKYIFKKGTGSLRIPFQSTVLTNKGTETESVKLIHNPANNELIDEILEAYPELGEYILINPEYKADEESEADPEDDDLDEDSEDDQTKEQKGDQNAGQTNDQAAPLELTPQQKRLATLARKKAEQAEQIEQGGPEATQSQVIADSVESDSNEPTTTASLTASGIIIPAGQITTVDETTDTQTV